MRKVALVLVAVACLGMTGCANMVPKIKETSTGYPEAFFENKKPEDVVALLSSMCIQRGYMVETATTTIVKCVRCSSSDLI